MFFLDPLSLNSFVDFILYIISQIINNCLMISNDEYLQSYEELFLMEKVGVSQKSKNRLYLCWKNSDHVQCKMIGPQTKCFCNHRFKQHQYLDPKGKKPFCKAPKCKCKCFDYIPTHGAYDFKCLCKHSFKEHDCLTKKCTKPNCKNCQGFMSTWTCSCGSKFIDHETVIETYEQRKLKGKAVNDMVRLTEQLNSGMDEKSLLKGIKQDPEVRVMKRESKGLVVDKKKESEKQELEEYILIRNKR